MSKRGAQGPQGSKESNLFEFNMSGTPDDKPQRATAAQLANRKIKDPRKRRTTTASTNAPAPSFGSPFNFLDPNPVASPGAGTQPMSNGFSFGQSQSFPGAGSNPPQSNQNGSSPFAFGSGTGSSSFNFSTMGGQSTGGNPFATMNTANTTAPSQPSTGGGFSFTGSTFGNPSNSVQAPAQQPPPAGGIFGSGSQQNNAPSGLFSFGASGPAASKPAPSAPASTGSIFGQSTTSTSAPPFGQQPSKSPPFGNSTAFGNDSMQTSPDAKSNGLAAKTPIFSAGASTGFGASTNSTGSGSVLGGSPTKPSKVWKPITPSAGPSTPSLFGATTPATTAVGTSSTPAPATTGTTPFLFGSPAPAKPAATPFQSTNLFAGAPKAPEEKKEDKPSEPPAKNPFQFAPSTSGPSTSGPSLFSKSETAAAPAAPASGLFQPPSSGSLFAPKPAVSAEQDKPKPAEASNPFGSLFAPKPATPTPATPSQPATEQKPLPAGNPFGSLFAPKPSTGETAKPSDGDKAATPAPLFSAPAPSASPPKPATPFGQPASPSGQSPAPTPAPATPSESTNQATTQPAPAPTANGIDMYSALYTHFRGEGAPSLEKEMGPSKLPEGVTPETEEEFELLHRVRMLNECFQRKVAALNPAKEDFLNVVEFYVRVRETFGAPTGSVTTVATKRKTRDDDEESEWDDEQPAKRVQAFFGTPAPTATPSKESLPAASPASPGMTTAAEPSGTALPTPAGGKRKSPDDSENTQGSPPKKVNGESSTANIFAQSFSKSKSDSQSESAKPEPSPAAQPSTPQTPKINFSTTPAASPSKPLFPAPAAANPPSTANSLFAPSASVSKPTFGTPVASSSPAPAPNPFTLKPSNGQSAAGAPASAPAIPKFGSGGVDFFAQFKSQADKNAEKEKQKRKAEDFDSDEDDEAEWERKDAEQQRKKREEAEAHAAKRPKFIPGKGFVFEDDSSDVATKPVEETTSGASVFETKTAAAPAKSNIFGHLSATPSEVEEPENNDGDDTEEASIDGDENGTTSKDSLFVSASEPSSQDVSETGSKAVSGSGAEFSGNDSSDDGDLSKALKKSKPAAPQKSEQAGNRSLMGRVQGSSTPKSQGEEEKKNPFANLFASPKPASSTGAPASTTANPFAPASKPASEQDASASKPATPNLFGAPTPAGGLFGSSAASSGGSTPSIFAAGQSPLKPAGDNTWKMNSPIKFASDSTPKPDSGSGTPANDAPKPFSTLFGAPAAGPTPGSGSSQPQSGFSFGNPSPSSSFLAPSSINSAAASRSTTPGASDTGADSSGDTEGAESLPQVDFSKGGAGEENEDAVMETRARAMKFKAGSGWESQGVGFLRVLKDRTTSRCRVLLRADPSGNIVLNTSLKKEISYTVKGNGVYFVVPQVGGTLEQWALRVKAEEAAKLGSAMEENKC